MGSLAKCSGMTYRGGMGGVGRREVQKGRDTCIHMADSLLCTAETSTTLLSNYACVLSRFSRV